MVNHLIKILLFLSISALINTNELLDNNSEVEILTTKDSRFFTFEIPGEGYTRLFIFGKTTNDKATLFINHSCSDDCVSKDVEKPRANSNCGETENETNSDYITLTSMGRCKMHIGLYASKIEEGIILRLRFQEITETSNKFEVSSPVIFDYENAMKYFSYTHSSKQPGVLRIYVDGVNSNDKRILYVTHNCNDSCKYQNIKFPNYNVNCEKSDEENNLKYDINIGNKESCMIYFSLYTQDYLSGINLKVRFIPILQIKDSSEYVKLENIDYERYNYFSFEKTKEMGKGLLYLNFKGQFNNDMFSMYSTISPSTECLTKDIFINYKNACDIIDDKLSPVIAYLLIDEEYKINFSLWPSKLYSETYLLARFIPIQSLKINEKNFKFTTVDNNFYNYFMVEIEENYKGKSISIDVDSENSQNDIDIYLVSTNDINCQKKDVIFPSKETNCYKTYTGYSHNKVNLKYDVKEATTLYFSIDIKKISPIYISITAMSTFLYLE